jgi:hypothetical protein
MTSGRNSNNTIHWRCQIITNDDKSIGPEADPSKLPKPPWPLIVIPEKGRRPLLREPGIVVRSSSGS